MAEKILVISRDPAILTETFAKNLIRAGFAAERIDTFFATKKWKNIM